MNLYLITQVDLNGWGCSDGAVVSAKTLEDAKLMTVVNGKVTIKLIGVAKRGIKSDILCTSFSASVPRSSDGLSPDSGRKRKK